jgi:predicted DNA-binding WGR domain protein
VGEEPHQLDLLVWGEAQPSCLASLDLGPLETSPDLVLLHHIDAQVNMHRLCRLRVARSPFGERSMARRWGRIGGTGQSLTEWRAAPEAAGAAPADMVSRKRRRGYR